MENASTETLLRVRDYDLAATLDSGQSFRWQPCNDSWVGVIGQRWVRLTQMRDGIRAETAGPVADWRWLRDYLQTETDLAAVLKTFPDDAPMRDAVAACHDLRVLRQDPWECLASFILSSTKQIVQIRQIVARLCERFGEPVSLSSPKGGEGRGEEADYFETQIPSPPPSPGFGATSQPSPRLGGARENMKDADLDPGLSNPAQRGNKKLPLPGERVGVRADNSKNYSAAARGLVLLRDSGLLEHILPELAATIACEQSPDFHPEGSVFNHICLMLEKMATPPPSLPGSFGAASESLPWAVLLHDIAKPVTAERDAATGKIHFYGHEKVGAEMAEKILQRLRFPKKQTEEIVTCVRHHMQFKDVKQMRKATLRRLLLRETFPLELELHRLDCLGSFGDLEHFNFLVEQAEALKQQPTIRPPLLTGDDLIALGVKPGKALGALLAEIRELQLADELKTLREARAWVKKKLAA